MTFRRTKKVKFITIKTYPLGPSFTSWEFTPSSHKYAYIKLRDFMSFTLMEIPRIESIDI